MKNMILLLCAGFWGCSVFAGLSDLVRDKYCNEEGSFAKGMNDARKNEDMNNSYAKLCRDADQDKFRKAYREGYMAGLKNGQQQAGDGGSGSAVTINIGGGGNSKRVLCELTPFTTTFSAWGSSKLEAQEKVKAKCAAKYADFQCTDFKCKTED